MKKKYLTGENITNLAILAVSITYLIYTKSNYQFGKLSSPKAGFMPTVLGAVAVIVSAIINVQSFVGKGDSKDVKLDYDWKRLIGVVGCSLLYVFLMDVIGYVISTFIFTFATMKISKVEGWKKPLIISLLVSLVFFVLFDIMLKVQLPAIILN